MAKRGLLAALDAHKGRDLQAEKLKKQLKAGEKRKRQRTEANDTVEDDDARTKKEIKKVKKSKFSLEDGVAAILGNVDVEIDEEDDSEDLQEGEDEEDDDDEVIDGTIPQPISNADASASEADPESDVPLSDLSEAEMEDAIPHQRLTINNGPALTASRKRVTIAKPKMPFNYHNSLISMLPSSTEAIPDPNDDLTRELEFYRIARDGVVNARTKLKKEKIPFTRPSDYFAEMAKSEEHMDKVKKKMYDEASGKKASEEAKKLRDAKKFGKAVQIAKEQERAKEKRATLDNIKELKKKRKGQAPTSTTEGDDLFQEIAVETDAKKRSGDRDRDSRDNKRQKRDSKFGFGGKKRFTKSGDAMSSADLSGFSARGMKGRGGGGAGRGGGGGGRGGRGGGGAAGRGAKRPTTKRLGKSRRVGGRD